MAASTITRATWTNDTGTSVAPNLDGTLINNTRLQNDIYAKIDEMFAGAGTYATFTLGGLLAVAGFGASTWSAGGTGEQSVRVRNTSAGTGNFTALRVGNDASATRFGMLGFSTTYTTVGAAVQDGLQVYSAGAGGISLDAQHASGPIRFYTGASTLAATLSASGLWTMAGFGAHAFSSSGTGGNTLTVRNAAAGTGNVAQVLVGNDVDGALGSFTACSSTFTGAGALQPNVATLRGNGALYFASGAATPMAWFVGSAEMARMLTTGEWQIVDGSATLPAIGFYSQPTTGLYYASSGVGVTVSGVRSTEIGSLGLTLFAKDNGAGIAGMSVYLGRNTNGVSGSAGHLIFNNLGGINNWVWVDNSGSPGVLRIGTTSPAAAGDTSGTVVGSQSSSLAAKHVHQWATLDTQRWALSAILETPIAEFSYRTQWPGERFWGLITDCSPLFGLDRDADHPGGRMLNEVMLHGCELLAIQALHAEIAALQAQLRELRPAA